MQNKDTSESLTIKIELASPEYIKKLVLEGMYYENYHYKVNEWENEVFSMLQVSTFQSLG